jgi:hypothetical protein
MLISAKTGGWRFPGLGLHDVLVGVLEDSRYDGEIGFRNRVKPLEKAVGGSQSAVPVKGDGIFIFAFTEGGYFHGR